MVISSQETRLFDLVPTEARITVIKEGFLNALFESLAILVELRSN
jgi:hypothetical protein